MQPDQMLLSPADSAAVRQLAQRTGKPETELLHEAVAQLLQQATAANRLAALRQARGMWTDRTDLPDFDQLRAQGWAYVAPANA